MVNHVQADKAPERKIEDIASALNKLHKADNSWRKIARTSPYKEHDMSAGTLCSIAGGWIPTGNRLRGQLGLPLIFDKRTQVNQGVKVCDKCSRSFIPNAWNRRFCYICSPIGGK